MKTEIDLKYTPPFPAAPSIPALALFENMPRAYRWPALYHRAMMLAFFWDEEKFQYHSKKMFDFVEWAFLDERRGAK